VKVVSELAFPVISVNTWQLHRYSKLRKQPSQGSIHFSDLAHPPVSTVVILLLIRTRFQQITL